MADTGSHANNAWLDAATFQTVVASTPLISIDLLVQNEQGEYLLGLRKNRPAQGCWFVPGGRVLKNESLDDAFKRLTRTELGLALERSRAVFEGVYEHFYQDSVFGDTPSTHYVVLGYRLKLSPGHPLVLPLSQHGEYRWWPVLEIKTSPLVHPHTQAYWPSL